MLQTLLKLVLLALLLLAGIVAWSFTDARLERVPPYAGSWPAHRAPNELSVEPLINGYLQSRAALTFRGGKFGEMRDFVVGGILIRHPDGNLLIDAGFGTPLDEHVRTLPKLGQWLTRYSLSKPMASTLVAAGLQPEDLDAIVLTHAHWDHASGLVDLPATRVLMTPEELAFVADGGSDTVLAREYENGRYEALKFADGPYLGFARSSDYFGDGSVVLVAAAGHTPGSLIVFISLADGRKLALIGDLAWQLEGVDRPAERPLLARLMVDYDGDMVRERLVQMHALKAAFPELKIVPAHDQRAWASMAP